MTRLTESAPEARTDSSLKPGKSDAREPRAFVMTPRIHRALRALMFALLGLIALIVLRGLTS
jgi:hypothetical protein